MPVDSDEKERLDTSDQNLRDITGITPQDEANVENAAANNEPTYYSGDDLSAAESSPDENDDENAADEKENIPYKDEGKVRNPRKKGLAVTLVAGSLIGVSLLGSTMIPNLVSNHLRELLLGKVAQLQNDQTKLYRRKKISSISDMFSKDGRRGSKIIVEMENSGYKFIFNDSTDARKISGIITPSGEALIGDAVGDHINDYIEVRHPLRTARWKTKRMNAFYDRYKVTRTPVVVPSPDDLENPDEAINKRMIQDIEGEEVEIETRGRLEGNEDDPDAATRDQVNADNEIVARDSTTYDELREKLRNGTSVDDLTPDEQNLLRIGAEFDEELFSFAEAATAGSVAGKTFTGVKSLFSSTDILDKVCTLKNRTNSVIVAARTFRAASMLRYAASFVKVSDATRAAQGNVDPTLFNTVMKRVTAKDKNGVSLGESPGMAYIIKNKFSKSKNSNFKGTYGVDGKLVGFPAAVQSSTNKIPGLNTQNCNIIQSPVTQVGVAVVELGVAIFTGGGSKALTAGSKEAAVAAFKQSLKSLVSKEAAIQLAKGVAIEVSFEGMLTMMQLYAERSTAVAFTGQETGGQLGDILAGGAGTLNKQRSLQGGMVPATADQYVMAQQEFIARKNEERQQQSLFARYFDYSNSDSITYSAMTSVATSDTSILKNGAEGVVGQLGATLASLPSRSITNLAQTFSSKTYAQSADDEIGFETFEAGGNSLATDPAGNLLPIMRSDIESIDPVQNIDYLAGIGAIDLESLEPISNQFKDHIKNCVDSPDTLTYIENYDGTVERDCLAKQDLTKRFKAHLAYIDMLDGFDADLFPEDLAGTSSTTAGSTSNQPVAGNTSDVQCYQGTTDLGVTDGYTNGQRYQIRLCGIPGFSSAGQDDGGTVRVNSTASENWMKLFQKAQSEGISLSANSSFRDMSSQEYLYGCYMSKSCNGGAVAARPGYSNHQIGFAIDIDIVPGVSDPALTTCQSNPPAYPVYNWLANNASSFGINATVSSECWHWSIGGS